MKLKACFLFAASLSSSASHGAGESAELRRALAFVQKHSAFWVSFTQTKRIDQLGLELKSEGRLEVLTRGHAIWRIEKPAFLQAEIRDGEVRLSTDPKGDAKPQVFRLRGGPSSNASARPGAESAWMELLNFNEESVRATFEITREGPALFRLQPRDAALPIRALVARIGTEGFFRELRIEESSGDAIEIRFQTPKAGRPPGSR